jgi:hypothetical protein
MAGVEGLEKLCAVEGLPELNLPQEPVDLGLWVLPRQVMVGLTTTPERHNPEGHDTEKHGEAQREREPK